LKKLLYITTVDKESDLGVYKKIVSQGESFERLGFEVKKTYMIGDEFYFDDIFFCKEEQGLLNKLANRFVYPKHIVEVANSDFFDIVYIRKTFINKSFIRFVTKLHKRGTKVVLEIPTYPYKSEISGLLKNSLYLVELYYSKQLKGRIDLISYFGEADEYIWDIPAIKLRNGVDADNIKKKGKRDVDGCVNFIGVANLAPWHGYDRFINSMSLLPPPIKSKVFLHIVGEGSVLSQLKFLSNSLSLQNNVFFHGIKFGTDLDDIFEYCDIGLDALGMFRAGFKTTSSLKTREYAARGMPFLSACTDCSFPDELDFVQRIPNDDSTFDLSLIIDKFNSTRTDADEIREYAVNNLSWDWQMIKVTNYLKLVD
jgi:glycosyltransferase involved in cell wall biosynthesis